MNILDALAGFDASLPDGQLVVLASASGVDRDSIVVKCRPARGNHGRHVVSWSQDGRIRSAEGNTLGTALKRAVRASGAVSASVAVHATSGAAASQARG